MYPRSNRAATVSVALTPTALYTKGSCVKHHTNQCTTTALYTGGCKTLYTEGSDRVLHTTLTAVSQQPCTQGVAKHFTQRVVNRVLHTTLTSVPTALYTGGCKTLYTEGSNRVLHAN